MTFSKKSKEKIRYLTILQNSQIIFFYRFFECALSTFDQKILVTYFSKAKYIEKLLFN